MRTIMIMDIVVFVYYGVEQARFSTPELAEALSRSISLFRVPLLQCIVGNVIYVSQST